MYSREKVDTTPEFPGNGHHNGHGRELGGKPTQELIKELATYSESLIRDEMRLARLELERLTEESRQMVGEAAGRLRSDVDVAGQEIKVQARKVATEMAAPIALGGLIAHAGFYVLLFAAVFGLALVLPLWAACLIVGCLTLGAGAVVGYRGVNEAKKFRWNPLKQTTQRLREDGQWMSEWASDKIRNVRSNLSGSA